MQGIYFRLKGFLFLGVLGFQNLIPLIWELSQNVILIDFTEQSFQLIQPLLAGSEPGLLTLHFAGLPVLNLRPYNTGKFFFILF